MVVYSIDWLMHSLTFVSQPPVLAEGLEVMDVSTIYVHVDPYMVNSLPLIECMEIW